MEFVLLTLVNGDRVIVRRDDIDKVVTYHEKLETIAYSRQFVIVVMKDGTKFSVKNDFDKLANNLTNNQ